MLEWLLEQGTKYAPLVKTGVAALSTYASYKDQQKKNEMQQAAYDDYMRDAAAAGHEAAAAIDLNLTPMEVSGVPTTKADVTDFTAVAAKGGLMSIPNRQRKRYARGPDEVDVMEFDEEVITPEGFKMETGVDVTGEQVFYNTGQGDRANAMMIWDQMESGDKMLFDFDFEIFFLDGGWRDMIKGEAPSVEGNTMMASNAGNDAFLENRYQELLELGLSPAEAASQAEKELSSGNVPGPMATGGIAGLRHGGRPGYQRGVGPLDIVYNPGVQMPMNPSQRGQQPSEKPDWFQDLYLDREGGGGKDFMVPEKYIDIFGGDERIDQMNIDAAEQETFKRGEGNRLMNHAIAIIKKAMNENPELGAQINKEFIAMANDKNLGPGDAYYTIIQKYGDILEMKKGGIAGLRNGGRPGYKFGDEVIADQETILKTPNEKIVTNDMEEIQGQTAGGGARGWKAQMLAEDLAEEHYGKEFYDLTQNQQFEIYNMALDMIDSGGMKKGGRAGYRYGDQVGITAIPRPVMDPRGLRSLPAMATKDGMMDLGGLEKDYRFDGGFVPIGEYEKKDDVPARLSKNEFVFTADAVRAAGGGSINKGAKRMYDTMKNLEARPEAQRMTA